MILRFSCKKSIQNKKEKAFVDYARQIKKKMFLTIQAKGACIAMQYSTECDLYSVQNAPTLLYRMRSRYSGVCTPNAVQNGGSTLANVQL